MLITPQTAGETRRYEDIMIEILRDNWGCLWCREAQLGNQVIWNPSGSTQNSVLAGTPRSQHGAPAGRAPYTGFQ